MKKYTTFEKIGYIAMAAITVIWTIYIGKVVLLLAGVL